MEICLCGCDRETLGCLSRAEVDALVKDFFLFLCLLRFLIRFNVPSSLQTEMRCLSSLVLVSQLFEAKTKEHRNKISGYPTTRARTIRKSTSWDSILLL
jgi:hypothetical protein